MFEKRDTALLYGMKPKTVHIYDEDTSIAASDLMKSMAPTASTATTSDSVTRNESMPCGMNVHPNGPGSPNGFSVSPEVNGLCQLRILPRSQKLQASTIQTMRAFDGLSCCIVESRIHPPRMPHFWSCTPVDWEQALTRSKLTVVLKLYDVMAVRMIMMMTLMWP